MISFQRPTTDSYNITVSLKITTQLLRELINNTLTGTVQDYLNYLLSTTNHTTASPTAYEPHIPSDWKGLSILYIFNNKTLLVPI